jgi:hypothetical protein
MADDFDAMFEAAEAEGRRALEHEPRAVKVRFVRSRRRLEIELANGSAASFPVALIEGLASATDAAIADVQVDGVGFGLHWERLDIDLAVAGLLAGVFGTEKWMNRLRAAKAGAATSAAKRSAARANGAKGGRPRARAAAAG